MNSNRRYLVAALLAGAFLVGLGLRLLRGADTRLVDETVTLVLAAQAPTPGSRSAPSFRNAASAPQQHEGRVGEAALDSIHSYQTRFHERDKEEWQGMPVDLAAMPPCERSANCGLARACVDSRCGPCVRDADCDSGEVCVLDHCLLANLAECRRRKDCPAVACALSGYTADQRGNGGMQSMCLTFDRVPKQAEPDYPASAFVSGPSRTKSFIEHLESDGRR